MAKNFGPGILGSVVLIDPETGLPYKAEGGGGSSNAGAFNYVGDWDADTDYAVGQVVRVTTSGNRIGALYFALTDNTAEYPIGDVDNWKPLSNADFVFATSVTKNSVLVRNATYYDPNNPSPLNNYFDWAEGNLIFSSWAGNDVVYEKGVILSDDGWLGVSPATYYLCIQTHYSYPPLNPDQDPEHWVVFNVSGGGGGSSNAVRSDATDTYAYMGTAPSGSDPATDDWDITRISLTDPNNPMHATGPWDDRATLTYA